MGSRSSLDGLLSELISGWPFDLDAGESIKFLPSANDRGFMQIGNGTNDMDLKVFLGGTDKYVLFDVGTSSLILSNVASTLSGAIGLTGDLTVTGNATVTGTLGSGDLTVTGNATVTDDLGVTGDISGGEDLDVVGNASIGGTITTGAATISGNATLSVPYHPIGFNAQSTRYELKWVAGQRGKPGINANIQDANEAVRMIADPDFEVLGTNGTSALSTFNTTGGILFTTAGADDDQMILVPHLDANQSAWAQTNWRTNTQVQWEGIITTGASIANCIIWAGLKLTNTPVVATDADQVYFRFDEDTASGVWQFVYSIADVDVAFNTSVTVAASTTYRFKIAISSGRLAAGYINEALVNTSAALTTNIALIPYIGVQAIETEASTLILRGQSISKAY